MKLSCPQLSISSRLVCTLTFACYVMLLLFEQVQSIGCFVCTSINGSDPGCEDMFNASEKYYKKDCMAGRKMRQGLFPGTNCIKLKAEIKPGREMIVRQCVVDGGGINSESEIGRSDHCNFINTIKFQGVVMKGCILSCNTNGCNDASSCRYNFVTCALSLLLTMVKVFFYK